MEREEKGERKGTMERGRKEKGEERRQLTQIHPKIKKRVSAT